MKEENETSLSTNNKQIARHAVEAEFQKKNKGRRRRRRRKRRNNDNDDDDEYGVSSSDDDDDEAHEDKKYKKANDRIVEEEVEEEESIKAKQDDLALRYRDRAKERREGTGSDNADIHNDNEKNDMTTTTTTIQISKDDLLVPRNIKGLDLALARKERQGWKKRNRFSASKDKNEKWKNIRTELPSMEEATDILRKFVDESNHNKSTTMTLSTTSAAASNNVEEIEESSTIKSRGLIEYIQEYMKYNDMSIKNRCDQITCGTAGRTIQNTKYSFAIDGHPSDTSRAWEIPRQYTISDAVGHTRDHSSSTMISCEMIDEIDRIFQSRQRVLEQMKQQHTVTTTGNLQQGTTTTTGAKDEPNLNNDVNDVDEDIFGGLDDYVPPVPKKD